MSICGLILSAGESGRMGVDKALLKYEGLPFVIKIAMNLSLICEKIIVVTGDNSVKIKSVVDDYIYVPEIFDNIKSLYKFNVKRWKNNLRVIHNPDCKMGMFTSLQKGIEEALTYDWTLYHFVDQPVLPNVFYSDFINEIDESFNWIQPEYKSEKGHPVLIGKSLYQKILDEPKESSLKNVASSTSLKKKIWNCRYPGIHQDIDTFDDFIKLSK